MEETLARRRPQQARSRAKVSAILEAAAAIIDETGVEALGTVAVVDRAGIAVGTFYQYFANKDALVDALVEKHLAAEVAIVRAVLKRGRFSTAEDVMIAVFDEFVEYFRTEPGFCRLWYNPAHFLSIKAREREADLVALRRIGHKLADLDLLTFDDEAEFDMVVLFSQLEALLGLAFRIDVRGDSKTLEKTREIIRMQTARLVEAARERKEALTSQRVAAVE